MSTKKSFQLGSSLKNGMRETIRKTNSKYSKSHLDQISTLMIDIDPENPREYALSPSDFKTDTVDGKNITRPAISPDDPAFKRKTSEIEELSELASSIIRSGVVQTLIVYKENNRFNLIAGERRLLASLIASEEFVPANIYPERPKNVRVIQYIENIHRKGLKPWEIIINIQAVVEEEKLADSDGVVSITALSNATSVSIGQASVYAAILKSPEDVREALKDGSITSLKRAAEISKIKDRSTRREIITSKSTLEEVKTAVKSNRQPKKIRKFSLKEDIADNTPKPRGPKAKFISLGKTTSVDAVQSIMKLLISEEDFNKIEASIQWDDFSSVTKAFNEAWKKYEETI